MDVYYQILTADRRGAVAVVRLQRNVAPAGEEPDERSPFQRHVIANRPAQDRLHGLEFLQDRGDAHRRHDLEQNLSANAGMVAEMLGKNDAHHAYFNVCTSTDSTDGKWALIVVQWSPPSGET